MLRDNALFQQHLDKQLSRKCNIKKRKRRNKSSKSMMILRSCVNGSDDDCFFSYGTRPTQYLLFHGRRFLFLQSLPIGALPAARSVTGEKLLSQSCILIHKTGCPFCITDSLQKNSATMRENMEVAACVVIVWS